MKQKLANGTVCLYDSIKPGALSDTICLIFWPCTSHKSTVVSRSNSLASAKSAGSFKTMTVP